MALFNQSTKTWQAAVQEIADTAGASADNEMTTRAHRSLQAGVEYFNARANWEFALTEADPLVVIGPFTVTGVTASAGQTSALAPVGHGLFIDDIVGGAAFGNGTRVTATAAGSFAVNVSVLSGLPAGANVYDVQVTRDLYTLPTAFKEPYSAKLLQAQVTLRLIRRRFYDRNSQSETFTSQSIAYDIFPIGAKGKLRLLPGPAATDRLLMRYYRRIAVATASAATEALDLPQDYEPYLIAWAKWHFLVDKGEGRSEQGSTWIQFANDGLNTMLADQTRIPDEDMVFIPGHYSYDPSASPNSTRRIDWDY